MARFLITCFGLLAILTVVSATSFWPAGCTDVDADFTTWQATAAALSYSNGYKKGHKGNDTAERWEAHGDQSNNVYSHNKKRLGPCVGSRMVTVTPPGNDTLNPDCPPAPNPEQAECSVPAFCPADNLCPDQEGFVPVCPPLEYNRFAGPQVAAHFQNQPGPFGMVDVRLSTYECVDARGTDPMLGTPGGDLAESMAFAMSVMKLLGRTFDGSIVDAVFDEFADKVANSDRPLYFHTDDASLNRMFVFLAGRFRGAQPSIFPFQAPQNETELEIWLDALVQPDFNGCGHIRLQLDPEFEDFYSVQVEGAVRDCVNTTEECVKATPIAERMIANYFRYWWPTRPGSEERRKVAFGIDGILIGPLLGKAVTVIQNNPKDACPMHAPLVRPTFGASKVFVYHGDAVAKWREYVSFNLLRPYLDSLGLNIQDFLDTWNAITGQQLGATLTWLVPGNRVGTFAVDIPVKDVSDDGHSNGKGDKDKHKEVHATSSP